VAKRVADRYRRDDSEFDRAIAFIDATFAVALTLLVTTLDFGSDPKTWDTFDHFYDAVGTQIVAFAISFTVIASYWLAHYQLFASFVSIDIRVIVANLALLAAIVLLPFTSATAGDPAIDHLTLPTLLLALDVAAVSGTFTLVYVLARKHRLLRKEPTPAVYRFTVLTMLAPALVFGLSVPIAIALDPGDARLFWVLLVVVNPMIGIAANRATRNTSA
jgi:uncharacterized membrane protein